LTVDGQPVATGVALVGDAWACTNPSLGRGMTFGLLHIQRLPETIRAHLDEPREFAEAWDEVTEAELTPWYRETVDEDRARIREIEALRNGREPEPPSGTHAILRVALVAAVAHDPDVFRAFLATRSCLTLQRERFANESFAERTLELAHSDRRPLPGPDRRQLLQILDGSLTAA
jgi:hypothetical protein